MCALPILRTRSASRLSTDAVISVVLRSFGYRLGLTTRQSRATDCLGRLQRCHPGSRVRNKTAARLVRDLYRLRPWRGSAAVAASGLAERRHGSNLAVMGASYYQFCPVAKAMELLAERWTLLIVRELVTGSQHFNELRRGVPRMSPTLLSRRLSQLARAGIVERRAEGSDV